MLEGHRRGADEIERFNGFLMRLGHHLAIRTYEIDTDDKRKERHRTPGVVVMGLLRSV